MQVKDILDEDFVNYKKPAMFISTCYCTFKCCKEANIDVSICQNSEIYKQKNIDIPIEKIFDRYIKNPITNSVVLGGLEPMLQFSDVKNLIDYFRTHDCNDDIVIYTGYYKEELEEEITELQKYANIIIKFGRYKPNCNSRYDDILGVTLISDNQYAERIS